ncbi:toxin biosynthesis protein [Penicillium taxi]|uniref:toxin biosynthesis protein n=1 Tax=Penicillium taxi TaxID=168475 RepID=UPI0025459A11|nr:toxin biosynthesis protein [Penicillium taxi]KAJ5900152.1 toxin biosynthesis protein [Penicillium taxi]
MVRIAKKKDTWPSRAIDAEMCRLMFRIWDPQVIDRGIVYVFHNLYSPRFDNGSSSVTLATTKHQELLSYIRGNFQQHREQGVPDSVESTVKPFKTYTRPAIRARDNQ